MKNKDLEARVTALELEVQALKNLSQIRSETLNGIIADIAKLLKDRTDKVEL